MNVINLADFKDIGEIRTVISSLETNKGDQEYIRHLLERAGWRILDAKIVEIVEEKQSMDGKTFIEKGFRFAYLLGKVKK